MKDTVSVSDTGSVSLFKYFHPTSLKHIPQKSENLKYLCLNKNHEEVSYPLLFKNRQL